jgi:hypothetical protein
VTAYQFTHENSVRDERDRLLLETDWVVLSAIERGNTVPQYWLDYRQKLRDIPSQPEFPYQVLFPVAP